MLIAKEKRVSNIGEYFLYMFQVEDLLRACQFDKDLIIKHLISKYNTDPSTITEIQSWYLGLSGLMEEEKLHEKGHLGFIKNLFTEVLDFHYYLLQNGDFRNYQKVYQNCSPFLSELRNLFPGVDNEIQLMVELIYRIFVLKLKKHPVSDETHQAMLKFAKVLTELSKNFNEYETGILKIN